MLTAIISLSDSEGAFMNKMIAEGHAASLVEVIIRALERYAEDQAVKAGL
jgi:hypothetical protein